MTVLVCNILDLDTISPALPQRLLSPHIGRRALVMAVVTLLVLLTPGLPAHLQGSQPTLPPHAWKNALPLQAWHAWQTSSSVTQPTLPPDAWKHAQPASSWDVPAAYLPKLSRPALVLIDAQ